MENTLDGIMVLDFKGKILLFNMALIRILRSMTLKFRWVTIYLTIYVKKYKLKAIKDQLNVMRG
jgi:hypothetical protein